MLHPRMISDLCRFPMWLIDELNFSKDGSVSINGWALADRDDLMTGEIAMNGRKPDVFHRVHSPAIANVFRWHGNTEMAGYRAVFHNVEPDKEELLRFSYRGRWTKDAFNQWQDIYFPLRAWLDRAYIEPVGARMGRTQGSTKFLAYVMYGTTAASMLNAAAITYFGKSLNDFNSICDWGCGCGRLIQAIRRIAPSASLSGIDIDVDNIDWCSRNIDYAKFTHVPLLPPTPFPDAHFDLLYGISVFTHLTREAFEFWRDELHRLVRPGGAVLVTVNRGASLVRAGNEELVLRTIATGFDDSSPDQALRDKIGDNQYYRGTFMMTSEVHNILGARFRIRDIIPQASGTSQDLVVCERL